MTATRMNEYIKNINNITDNSDYRTFLQNNGEKIMKKEREYSKKNKLCNLNKLSSNNGLNAFFPVKKVKESVEPVTVDVNAAELDELTEGGE